MKGDQHETGRKKSTEYVQDYPCRDTGIRVAGYGQSSINTICSEGGISKGILYHYFKDKDEIYLACIKECFGALTSYLREHVVEQNGDVQAYFNVRYSFFKEHPQYQNLFCEAVISPPAHLKDVIGEIKADLDALNVKVLTGFLESQPLRNGIRSEKAIEVIVLFQDFVNARYQMPPGGDFDIAAHEELCRRSLDILLYGIIEQEGIGT